MLNKIKNIFKNMNEEKNISGETAKNEQPVSEHVKTVIQENEPEVEKEPDIELPPTGEKIYSAEEVKEEVKKVLKTCYDPEIPVDVLELGLIYDILVAANRDVMIVMTLTSPSCPVAGILPAEIEQKVKDHPMVRDCKVQLTFDPPWNFNMMSEVAKLELGFL